MGEKTSVGKLTLFCLLGHFCLNNQVIGSFPPPTPLTLPITMQRWKFRFLLLWLIYSQVTDVILYRTMILGQTRDTASQCKFSLERIQTADRSRFYNGFSMIRLFECSQMDKQELLPGW